MTESRAMDYPRPALVMPLNALQIQKILPHRYPFLFIDRVVEVEAGERILAEKLLSQSEPILQGHFPGFPVLPGVVQVEAMAQAAAILANQSGHFDPETHHCLFIGIQEAKFRAAAVPGEVLSIEVKALRLGRRTGRCLEADAPHCLQIVDLRRVRRENLFIFSKFVVIPTSFVNIRFEKL